MNQQRVTNEEIVKAYMETGSVWKAGKRLGIVGQSVWELLVRLGYPMHSSRWTAEEENELRQLVSQCTVGEIARRLGRPYAGVAAKISELGIGSRFGNRQRRSLRGSGLTKRTVSRLVHALRAYQGSLRQFARQRGLDLELMVQALQRYEADAWREYCATHSSLDEKQCPHCGALFIPLNKKQQTCSRRCSSLLRTDRKYFGGKRKEAFGMAAGVCQLCERPKQSLAAHHIFGKENDPENDYLLALCRSCHRLVGILAVRADEGVHFWENLIILVHARRMGARKPLGLHAAVEVEELSADDLEAMTEQLV